MTEDEKTKITYWIDTINDEGINMNVWELGFMESLTEQWESIQWISENQLKILERIYASNTP